MKTNQDIHLDTNQHSRSFLTKMATLKIDNGDPNEARNPMISLNYVLEVVQQTPLESTEEIRLKEKQNLI